MGTKKFEKKKSTKNLQKTSIFGPFLVQKMAKTKFLVELFLIGIDSRWFKTYLDMKISISKLFPLLLSSGDLAIFRKIGVIGRKNGKHKNFRSNFFLIGNDSEWSKTYFKMKIPILKKTYIMTFLWGHSRFLKNGSHCSNDPLEPKDLTRL